MHYLDLGLEIGPGQDGNYPLTMNAQSLGQARTIIHFPFDDLTLENYLLKLEASLARSLDLHRRIASPQEQAIQEFGQKLFDILFSEPALKLFDASCTQALQAEKTGVRLNLKILAPELAALPWEYLYDGRQGEYLCLSKSISLVRSVDLPRPIQPLEVVPPLHILGMIANPQDQDQLDIQREQERMHQALGPLESTGRITLNWMGGQTWRDLQRAMWEGPWHVFHFIGHGGFDVNGDEGVIALADEQGKTHLLSATQLGRLLANHGSIRLVVLNACNGARGSKRDLFSSSAAIVARRGIPAVLAMQQEITDRAAIELTRTFYNALSYGMPVDAAVTEARTAMSLALSTPLEWGTPVLYLRALDGVLFTVPAPPADLEPNTTSSLPFSSPGTPPDRVLASSALVIPPLTPSQAPRARDQQLAVMSPARSAVRVSPGTPIAVCADPVRYATSQLAWSSDGKYIASSALTHPSHSLSVIDIWDVSTGHLLCSFDTLGEKVSALSWAPDSQFIAASCAAFYDHADPVGAVMIWNPATEQTVKTLQDNLGKSTFDVAWSPDGRHLAATYQVGERQLSNRVKVWQAAEGWEEILSFPHGSTRGTLAWSPNGQRITSLSSAPDTPGYVTIQDWDISKGQCLKAYQCAEHQKYRFLWDSMMWSSDGLRLCIAASNSETTIVEDLTTGEALCSYEGGSESSSWPSLDQPLHIISPRWKGGTLVLEVKDTRARQTTCIYRGQSAVGNIAWSPDGTRVASVNPEDGSIHIWQAG